MHLNMSSVKFCPDLHVFNPVLINTDHATWLLADGFTASQSEISFRNSSYKCGFQREVSYLE